MTKLLSTQYMQVFLITNAKAQQWKKIKILELEEEIWYQMHNINKNQALDPIWGQLWILKKLGHMYSFLSFYYIWCHTLY